MSKQPSTIDDRSTDTETESEETTDWQTAVVDAIQHLEGYGDPGGDWSDKQEFQMKAAHDRLARLNTSEAPRHAAETIRDVVDVLAETPDVPHDEHGIIGQTALAQLAPLAARVARYRANSAPVIDEGEIRASARVEPDQDPPLTIDVEVPPWVADYDTDGDPCINAHRLDVTVRGDEEGPAPESIDELPTVEQPTEGERHTARRRYGAEAVPEAGPIPDPNHEYNPQVTVSVPGWALEATRRFLESRDAAELDRTTVQGELFEHVQVDEQLRMPDGRDAVDALLEERRDE